VIQQYLAIAATVASIVVACERLAAMIRAIINDGRDRSGK
jgi:hypothetical protein